MAKGAETATRAKWLDSGVLELQSPLVNTVGHQFDDLVLESGRDVTLRFRWCSESNTPIDVSSGYTASFTLSTTRTGAAALSLTQGSGITLGAGANQPGNIVIALTDTQTSALTQGGRYFHRLTITHTASGKTFVLLYGAARCL